MKHLYLFKTAAICSGLFLLSHASNAQMVDCNVFVQGHYVEMAIAPNGAYGSTVTAPLGYHNNVVQSFSNPCTAATVPVDVATLGFVADPAMDGWTVGTPPYYGDYYMPGTPQEGWAIQVAHRTTTAYMTYYEGAEPGTDLSAINGYNDTTTTGGNISYTDSAGILKSVWQGTWSSAPVTVYTTDTDTVVSSIGVFDSVVVSYDTVIVPHYNNIQITQVTTLDTNALFFTTKVTFTNLLDSATDDIYYIRTVDPDNDVEEPGGGYTTLNKIIDTLPGAVVTATGLSSPESQLTLCSPDSNARAFILTRGLQPLDLPSRYYDRTAFDLTLMDTTIDVGIGLVFKVGSLSGSSSTGSSGAKTTGVGSSKTITYSYAFGANAVKQALGVATPTAVNSIASPEVKIYPNPFNDQLSISGLNSTDRLALYDVMGRRVEMNGSINNGGTSTFTIVDAPAAHYILEVTDNKGSVKTKIPVQKL